MQTLLSVVGGILAASCWSLYGCKRVKPGGWQRWLFFASSGVLLTVLVWMPLVDLMGLHLTEMDVYLGAVAFTVLLYLVIGQFLPNYVWCVYVDEYNPYADEEALSQED